MRSDFKIANLVGTVYRQGNLVFTEDGTKLLSPVGNRVSCFDLINNVSFTFNYQHRKNINRIALNKQATLMLTVDEDGRGILVNFVSRVVLHHFNFKGRVYDLKFSNDGHFFVAGVDRFVQIWKTPDFTEDRQFAPFVRYKNYAGHHNDVIAVSWSEDSRFVLSTSKDMTCRIFSLHNEDKDAAMTLAGHRDYVIRAFFDKTQEIIYTISKDGALFQWEYLAVEEDDSDDSDSENSEHSDSENPEHSDSESSDSNSDDSDLEMTDLVKKKPTKIAPSEKWTVILKNYLRLEGVRVTCADFHAQSNILVLGLSSGEFRLYELPDFNLIQQLSMGQHTVDTVTVSKSGEWFGFGSSKAGQLLVYEWQSESYILKQQGISIQ